MVVVKWIIGFRRVTRSRDLPRESKKLHHFILAITLSNKAIFWQFLVGVYLRKFSITSVFHILHEVDSRYPARVSTAERASTALHSQAASSRDARRQHSTNGFLTYLTLVLLITESWKCSVAGLSTSYARCRSVEETSDWQTDDDNYVSDWSVVI